MEKKTHEFEDVQGEWGAEISKLEHAKQEIAQKIAIAQDSIRVMGMNKDDMEAKTLSDEKLGKI